MDTTTIAIVAPSVVIIVIVTLMTIRPSAAPGVSQVLGALSGVLRALFPWTSTDQASLLPTPESTRGELSPAEDRESTAPSDSVR